MLSQLTKRAYQQLADWLAGLARAQPGAVIGINGAQGSGKSSLAWFLAEALQQRGLRVAVLSLDDCYLGNAARQQLAQQVHPLLATRGVPGTHDVELGRGLLSALINLKSGASLAMPQFSKADDDFLSEAVWPQVAGAFDLILFEGWCVGTPPQKSGELDEPINKLEREEDPDGRWRHFVNDQLAGAYAQWFAMLDALVYLQIPGFEQVAIWRGQQERETARQSIAGGQGLMDTQALQRFIQHYERLTRYALAVLPQRADACLRLDSRHEVADLRIR